MKTYFVRHSGDLALADEELQRLRQRGMIAVHFPFTANASKDDPADSSSIDPDDYGRSGKIALRGLHDLATNGGYVCATYRDTKTLTIGKVAPGTPIELVQSKWSSDSIHPGRVAVLKALKLSAIVDVPASKQSLLLSVLPRQGTFCVWHGIRDRVQHLIEGTNAVADFSSLHPTYQEVLCAEFLREHSLPDIPRLVHLLQPVGRTMVDVDILGLADDGKLLRAQVTYKSDQGKVDRLAAYGDAGDHLLFFCNVEAPYWDGRVLMIPTQLAFRTFTDTDSGRAWMARVQELV